MPVKVGLDLVRELALYVSRQPWALEELVLDAKYTEANRVYSRSGKHTYEKAKAEAVKMFPDRGGMVKYLVRLYGSTAAVVAALRAVALSGRRKTLALED